MLTRNSVATTIYSVLNRTLFFRSKREKLVKINGAWPNVIDLRNILVGEITKMKEGH